MNYKFLFIVSSDNINAPTGAAKFCGYFLERMDYWYKNNIIIKEFSNSESFSNSEKYVKSRNYKIKQWIKKIFNISRFGKRLFFFNYKVNKLGKRPINKLKNEINLDSCILLNDIYVAINFYEQFHSKYTTIFMMHNGGNLLRMMPEEMNDKKIANYLKRMESIIYTNASKIIFVSKYAKEKFDIEYPMYNNKTIYIYNGIPNRDIDTSQRQYNFLNLVTVGSVCKRKNQIAILKALKRIEDKTIKLTIVGDGPSLEVCKKYVKENEIEDQIDFVGSQNDVIKYLKRANAFIMTSIEEGLPIAAQEALNVHLPIIITDVGGCRDLIQNNGLLIELNENEIVNAIQKFNDEKNRLKDYGNASYQIFINNFTIDLMIEKYCKLINSL